MNVVSMKTPCAVAAGALAFCLLAGGASAEVTYIYTGNGFTSFSGSYSASSNVTISFTVPTALAPNLVAPASGSNVTPSSFVISDGVVTVRSGVSTFHVPNSLASEFEIGTDANGNIDSWFIQDMEEEVIGFDNLKATDYYTTDTIATSNKDQVVGDSGSIGGNLGAPYSGSNSQDPGSWAIAASVPVPEPASWAMMVLGLAGAGLALRIRRQSIDYAEPRGA